LGRSERGKKVFRGRDEGGKGGGSGEGRGMKRLRVVANFFGRKVG